jgi:hypothetical protein
VFEDWSEDVAVTYGAPPWPSMAGVTERELALYRELWTCTAPGSDMAHVRHKVLAGRIGLKSDRQVRTLMARLYARGWVLPIRSMVPNPSGGQRRGANYYRLLVPLHAFPPPTVRKWPEPPLPQVAPLGSGRRLPSKNVGNHGELRKERKHPSATTGDAVSNPSGRLFEIEEPEREREPGWWTR